jgi:hypothetical protein
MLAISPGFCIDLGRLSTSEDPFPSLSMARLIWSGSSRWVLRQLFRFFYFSYGVRLSPLGTAATVWPIIPAPDDTWWSWWNNRWDVNWQGKPKYLEETYPVPFCPPQIPHDLTRAIAVRSRRLTAWIMAQSTILLLYVLFDDMIIIWECTAADGG